MGAAKRAAIASERAAHATGAIVTADAHLTTLVTHLTQWQNGVLSTHAAALLVDRAAKQLATACFCDDSEVCCTAHARHSSPHRGCILR